MTFIEIARVTLRALLGRRRTILMLLLAAVPILVGLLVRAYSDGIGEVAAPLDGLVVRIVLPLIALVFGTAALGMELEDGTGVHLLTKPISRWQIIVAKTFVAGTLTAALIVPSTVISGLLMGGFNSAAIEVTFAFALANIVGSYLYTAIFLVLSVITTRGLIIGLAYALIWEAVVAGLLPGSQIFSVREYLNGIAITLAPDAVEASLVGATGFLYAAVAFALAIAIGTIRLSRYEVRGAE